MIRTQIYLPKTYLDELRKEARQNRGTMSGIIRQVLKKRYEQNQFLSKTERYENLIEAARRISRIGPKGPKDLSSRLDEYLYGDI